MAAPKKQAEAKPAPVASDEKTTTLESPWGSKVTVPTENVEVFLDGGFKK